MARVPDDALLANARTRIRKSFLHVPGYTVEQLAFAYAARLSHEECTAILMTGIIDALPTRPGL